VRGKNAKAHEARDLTELGKRLFSSGEYPEAIVAFGIAIDLHPRLAEPNTYIGKAYLECQQPQNAVRAFREALRLKQRPKQYCDLCWALINADDLLAAQAVVESGLEKHPRSPDLHYHLGLVYKYRGSELMALQQYTMAVNYNPKHVEALTNLGVHSSDRGDFQTALTYFERALVVDSKSLIVLENVVLMCMNLNLEERGKEVLATLFAIHPNSRLIPAINPPLPGVMPDIRKF